MSSDSCTRIVLCLSCTAVVGIELHRLLYVIRHTRPGYRLATAGRSDQDGSMDATPRLLGGRSHACMCLRRGSVHRLLVRASLLLLACAIIIEVRSRPRAHVSSPSWRSRTLACTWQTLRCGHHIHLRDTLGDLGRLVHALGNQLSKSFLLSAMAAAAAEAKWRTRRPRPRGRAAAKHGRGWQLQPAREARQHCAQEETQTFRSQHQISSGSSREALGVETQRRVTSPRTRSSVR